MKNESNREVKIIDENYIKRYGSTQKHEFENFQNISLDNYEEQQQPRTFQKLNQNLFENKKRETLDNKSAELPNSDFEVQQAQQEQADFLQQLPNPNFQDLLNSEEQELLEMISRLLQDEQPKSSEQQKNNNRHQQSLQSLIPKQDGKSIKEVDENYKKLQEQTEQQDNMNLDEQLEQSQQSEDGQRQSEGVKEALKSLIDKKDSEQNSRQSDSTDGTKDPNFDDQTPITATFLDSNDLSKLNVDWASEDTPQRQSEKTNSYGQTRMEDELLKTLLKYLVKTNYYVKTYGLDKKK